MIHKTTISLNLGGLVLFDPEVLNQFVLSNNIQEQDLFQYFIDNPDVGTRAINEGTIVPVYTITPWDYSIVLNTGEQSVMDATWRLFATEILFPLQVTSGKVIVSDIYGIMDWQSKYFLNFPPRSERLGVDDDISIDPGLYAVQIIGFRDKNNPDVERRECGYEFWCKQVAFLSPIPVLNIDHFNFMVDGVAPGSN
jgi:hypothetical protein